MQSKFYACSPLHAELADKLSLAIKVNSLGAKAYKDYRVNAYTLQSKHLVKILESALEVAKENEAHCASAC